MSRLIHLIYNSAAVIDFSEAELTELLRRARSRNAAMDVTGMLLHVDGTFFQVLEGPEDAVATLAADIERDGRHAKMTTIIREPIAQRAFGEWTMGFSELTEQGVRSIDGLNDFFGSGQVLTELDPGRARKLLTAFRDGRWRVQLAARAPRRPEGSVVRENAPSGVDGDVAPGTARPAFSFAYQPIVDVAARRVAGYEALVRGPAEEPAAEVLQRVPLGEIPAFDEDGRRRAIGLATRLGLTGDLHLNTIPQLREEGLGAIESTLDTARRCGLEPRRLVLEIKHEATVNDPERLAGWLGAVREQGLRISIDDFGSGHAGLALLDHYQPELISLSMWLVRGIDGHGPRQAILRGLVQTCGDLGIDIVAKGVETGAEYAWLRAEGIHLFQGHLLARPGFEALPRPVLPAEAL